MCTQVPLLLSFRGPRLNYAPQQFFRGSGRSRRKRMFSCVYRFTNLFVHMCCSAWACRVKGSGKCIK